MERIPGQTVVGLISRRLACPRCQWVDAAKGGVDDFETVTIQLNWRFQNLGPDRVLLNSELVKVRLDGRSYSATAGSASVAWPAFEDPCFGSWGALRDEAISKMYCKSPWSAKGMHLSVSNGNGRSTRC